MFNHILEITYLIASVTFIIGLKMLSHPDTARKGNLVAAAGMTIAVVATFFFHHLVTGNYVWILGGLFLGTIIGTVMAKKVKMTAMPQMVSFFNGMGGACVAVIALIEFTIYDPQNGLMTSDMLIILAGLLIGSIAFSGSMIAYGKLEGIVTENAVKIPFQTFINAILLLVIIGIGYYLMTQPVPNIPLLYVMFALCLLYGVLFVIPIGGADMPVVVSLLNSFTGVAAALAGFLYNNSVMLTGGILVGSAGSILTILMCKAMNRSLMNVLIGSFGGQSGGGSGSDGEKHYKETSCYDTAVMLSYARKVVIVPGYGLAVAQAQHTCRELDKLLEEKGVEVKYAVHPVAGRMPGHMNVLLAEADVPYPMLLDMDEINPEFVNTDVVLVLGANDVVNPVAKTDPSSPIYGMPILDAEDAKQTVIVKRSMGVGYAGIDNILFYRDKTSMLFGDAKKVLQDIVNEIKQL